MKKYALAAVVTVVFISFQNCAPNKANSPTSEAGPEKAETQFNKVSASDFSVLSLWDSGCDEGCTHDQVVQAQPRYLDINLSNGLMESVPLDRSLPHEKFCISSLKLDELRSILAGADVCDPVIPAGYFSGRVCSMSYTNPYALLKVDASEVVPLGEKTSGCDIPTDLCGDKAQQLRLWRNSIVSNLSNSSIVRAANNQGSCP